MTRAAGRACIEILALILVLALAVVLLRLLLDAIVDHLGAAVPMLIALVRACATTCWNHVTS